MWIHALHCSHISWKDILMGKRNKRSTWLRQFWLLAKSKIDRIWLEETQSEGCSNSNWVWIFYVSAWQLRYLLVWPKQLNEMLSKTEKSEHSWEDSRSLPTSNCKLKHCANLTKWLCHCENQLSLEQTDVTHICYDCRYVSSWIISQL